MKRFTVSFGALILMCFFMPIFEIGSDIISLAGSTSAYRYSFHGLRLTLDDASVFSAYFDESVSSEESVINIIF